jgi:hypothetical protein
LTNVEIGTDCVAGAAASAGAVKADAAISRATVRMLRISLKSPDCLLGQSGGLAEVWGCATGLDQSAGFFDERLEPEGKVVSVASQVIVP